jgi:hypothetical protein
MQGTPPSTSATARKRLRTNSFDASDADNTLVDLDTGPGVVKVVRDSIYYNPSGDCKIRVDDTLFCVRSFKLTLHVFEKIFLLRFTAFCLSEARPSLKPCFSFLRAENCPKVQTMMTPSFLWATLSKNSALFAGHCTHCKSAKSDCVTCSEQHPAIVQMRLRRRAYKAKIPWKG